jgi:protein-S-isoprenylcysteine O-methyltransferase Ste14
LLAGWLAHRAWPLAITAPGNRPREAVAALAIVLWLGLMASALGAFRRVRTTMIPNRPAAALATGGPYRFTRNPVYLSLAALYVGLALLLNSWWPVALLPLVVLVMNRAVIGREERYLAGAFPAEYAAYRARVRRWL